MFFNALPGAISLGLIWGLMAIGVFITYKVLDFADSPSTARYARAARCAPYLWRRA